MSKLAKFKKRRNPASSTMAQTAIGVAAGFGGYAINRLVSRAVYSLVLKRQPRLAAHTLVGASALAVVGTYFISKYWRKVSDYHEHASIGSSIALLQAIMRTYVPRLGWVVSDVSPEQYKQASAPRLSAKPAQAEDAAEEAEDVADEDLSWGDDEFSWGDGEWGDEEAATQADAIN